MLFVALISLFGGYLMKVYAWRTILGTEGIINNALLGLGIVSEPVTWLLYNPPSVVLTLTNFLRHAADRCVDARYPRQRA